MEQEDVIPVTKPYLPPLEEYVEYLKGIWDREYLTNNGPLVKELESELRKYLGVKHCLFVNNGTIALQLAIKALDLKGEVITTPFSFVATTSSIVWENCKPIFVDIDKNTLNIDPNLIEEAITEDTTAILATHVFGNPCNVEKIRQVAEKYNLKVIYDGAHGFGVNYRNQSLLSYGDISTTSFHATKLFNTVEGGAVITNDDHIAHKIKYMRNFGFENQESFYGIGINGKNSELHAAFGLCVLPKINKLISRRKEIAQIYNQLLKDINIVRPLIQDKTEYNFAYYPIIFSSERILLDILEGLNNAKIYPRRYFHPSLNKLPYVKSKLFPNTDDISSRIMCLPLYNELSNEDVIRICEIILNSLENRYLDLFRLECLNMSIADWEFTKS